MESGEATVSPWRAIRIWLTIKAWFLLGRLHQKQSRFIFDSLTSGNEDESLFTGILICKKSEKVKPMLEASVLLNQAFEMATEEPI